MSRLLRLLSVAATLLPILPQSAAAQEVPADSGFRLRVGGNIEVPANEREAGIVVIRGDARVVGRVGTVIVIDGAATLDSGLVSELVVVRGRAVLANGAVVAGDVHLVNSTIDVAEGSRVGGRIERGMGPRFARKAAAAVALISLGVLGALVLAGVLVAVVAPDGLIDTGQLIRTELGRVAGATALLWLAFPFVALLLVPTLVGLPVGLGYFVFVMPTLGFLGLIVSGAWLGDEMLRRIRRADATRSPVASTAFGITVLLLVGRIPILGVVATVLVMLGAGAVLVVTARRVRRARSS